MMDFKPDSFCHFCGNKFPCGIDNLYDRDLSPRTCNNCKHQIWKNPIPVAVAVVPVLEPLSPLAGLLVIRRSIPPRIGELALPGGFINRGETWQEAVSRELREETGVSVPAKDFDLIEAHSSLEANVIVIFGYSNKPLRLEELPEFKPSDETSERLILHEPQELAFPLHTAVVERYFK